MEDIQFEQIRLKFLPSEVNVLFIGESPPAGGTFFYLGKSILFNTTKVVFEEFYNKDFSNPLDFLDFFKNLGCFLDDLCHSPVNHIKDLTVRNKPRYKSIKGLANRLKCYNPKRIISIMKNPYFNMCIDKAINLADIDINIKFNPLPFPRYNRDIIRYKLGLKKYIRKLKDFGII